METWTAFQEHKDWPKLRRAMDSFILQQQAELQAGRHEFGSRADELASEAVLDFLADVVTFFTRHSIFTQAPPIPTQLKVQEAILRANSDRKDINTRARNTSFDDFNLSPLPARASQRSMTEASLAELTLARAIATPRPTAGSTAASAKSRQSSHHAVSRHRLSIASSDDDDANSRRSEAPVAARPGHRRAYTLAAGPTSQTVPAGADPLSSSSTATPQVTSPPAPVVASTAPAPVHGVHGEMAFAPRSWRTTATAGELMGASAPRRPHHPQSHQRRGSFAAAIVSLFSYGSAAQMTPIPPPSNGSVRRTSSFRSAAPSSTSEDALGMPRRGQLSAHTRRASVATLNVSDRLRPQLNLAPQLPSELVVNYARDAVEDMIMQRLYGYTFGVSADDQAADLNLDARIGTLQWVSLEQLEVPPKARQEAMLTMAAAELRKMSSLRTPRAMLQAIISALDIVVRALSLLTRATRAQNGQDRSSTAELAGTSADDIVPVFIAVVLRARVPQLASCMAYIQRFRDIGRLMGKEGYCLTQLQGAVAWLESVTPRVLGVTAEEWNEQCGIAAARVQEERRSSAAGSVASLTSPRAHNV